MTKALGIAQGAFGRVALLDMDTSLVRHAHPHCHIVMKAAGPDQSFVVRGEPFPLRQDTAILVNAWEQHQYAHSAAASRTLFLALYLNPAWIADAGGAFSAGAAGGGFSRPCVTITPAMSRLRDRLVECLQSSDDLSRQSVAAQTAELVLSLTHRYQDGPGTMPGRRRVNDFRIRRAINLLREQPSACNDLDRVAAIAGLSRPRFNELFRLCTGVTPGLYANALRVEQAVQGLAVRRGSIASVSEQGGFTAQSNFSRFFEQHTGVRPRQFRKVLISLGR